MSATNGIGYHVAVLSKSGWTGCPQIFATMAEAEAALPAHRLAQPGREFMACEALKIKVVKHDPDPLRDWMVSAGLVAR